VHLSVRSTNTIFLKLRRRLAAECEAQAPFSGQVEIDEGYVGPHRVRGRRARGAIGKTIVFGIYKRNGTVYTRILPNIRRATLIVSCPDLRFEPRQDSSAKLLSSVRAESSR
jgi:transposase-like protein